MICILCKKTTPCKDCDIDSILNLQLYNCHTYYSNNIKIFERKWFYYINNDIHNLYYKCVTELNIEYVYNSTEIFCKETLAQIKIASKKKEECDNLILKIPFAKNFETITEIGWNYKDFKIIILKYKNEILLNNKIKNTLKIVTEKQLLNFIKKIKIPILNVPFRFENVINEKIKNMNLNDSELKEERLQKHQYGKVRSTMFIKKPLFMSKEDWTKIRYEYQACKKLSFYDWDS